MVCYLPFLEQFGLLSAFHIPLELLAEAELMCCSEACIGLVELVAVNVRIVHAWLHIWDITFASLDSICSNQCAAPLQHGTKQPWSFYRSRWS